MTHLTHITAQGDTFELLALRYYNNELMAHHIAQENRKYFNIVTFDGGIELKIPILQAKQSDAAKPPWERS